MIRVPIPPWIELKLFRSSTFFSLFEQSSNKQLLESIECASPTFREHEPRDSAAMTRIITNFQLKEIATHLSQIRSNIYRRKNVCFHFIIFSRVFRWNFHALLRRGSATPSHDTKALIMWHFSAIIFPSFFNVQPAKRQQRLVTAPSNGRNLGEKASLIRLDLVWAWENERKQRKKWKSFSFSTPVGPPAST